MKKVRCSSKRLTITVAMPHKPVTAAKLLITWLRKTYKFNSGTKIKFEVSQFYEIGTWKHMISVYEDHGFVVDIGGSTSYWGESFNLVCWDGDLRFKSIWNGNKIYNMSDPKFFEKLERHVTYLLKNKCRSFISKR